MSLMGQARKRNGCERAGCRKDDAAGFSRLASIAKLSFDNDAAIVGKKK